MATDGDQWKSVSRNREGEIVGVGIEDSIINHGGVVHYDRSTEIIITGDGTKFSLQQLMAANPGVPARMVEHTLETVAIAAARSVESFRSRTEGLTRSTASIQAVQQAAQPIKLWTADDALTLILETIRHSDDPNAAAGEWLTKVTNGIIEITREFDE